MKEKKSKTQGSRYYPKRYNTELAYRNSIIDEALVCHVSFYLNDQVFCIPTGHCRIENTLYLHGSVGSHFFMNMAKGIDVCVTITLVDALVLARSVFNHSVNYRSVVAFGKTKLVVDEKEKLKAAKRFTDHMILGRWEDARQPNASEMKKTMFISVDIEESSVKFRDHGVADDVEDLHLPVWAGILPTLTVPQKPIQDENQNVEIPLPNYLAQYSRKK